jgi:hypothetical protein
MKKIIRALLVAGLGTAAGIAVADNPDISTDGHELARFSVIQKDSVQLVELAASADTGTAKAEKLVDEEFARANHALALEHRAKAAESWGRKEYDKAGYELTVAADALENAGEWAGTKAKAGSSAVAAETRALGDKLEFGATWTRDEVAKGFESLGNAINAVGQQVGGTRTAARFDAGA